MPENCEIKVLSKKIYPPIPVKSKKEPEINGLMSLEPLFYFLKATTHQSSIKSKEKFERPIFIRAYRAGLYKSFKESRNRLQRREILEEARLRDDLAKQYLTQGRFEIAFPEEGTLSSQYTVLDPVKTNLIEPKTNNPPVILIPGLGGDLEYFSTFAHELAFRGRKAILLAYPESRTGFVNPEYAKAIKESSSLEIHAKYYKQAINALLPNNQKFEIWGHSTGSEIAFQILQDANFQRRVVNAVAISPAASANLVYRDLVIAAVPEVLTMITNFNSLPKYFHSSDERESISSDQNTLKKQIVDSVLKIILKKSIAWEKARVSSEGKIIVVTTGKDRITRCFEAFNPQTCLVNPQIKVLNIPNAYHHTAISQPEKILDRLLYK